MLYYNSRAPPNPAIMIVCMILKTWNFGALELSHSQSELSKCDGFESEEINNLLSGFKLFLK